MDHATRSPADAPRHRQSRVAASVRTGDLVETVDNFGTTGLPPSNPELLDYLAYRFVHHHKWSIKSLIRELVQTRTYQLSSDFDKADYAADPGNQSLWRMSRRRLEAEPFRDAMLAVSGKLIWNARTHPLSRKSEKAKSDAASKRNIFTNRSLIAASTCRSCGGLFLSS